MPVDSFRRADIYKEVFAPCHRHATDDALNLYLGHRMGAGHPDDRGNITRQIVDRKRLQRGVDQVQWQAGS